MVDYAGSSSLQAGFSLVVARRGFSLVAVCGLLPVVASLAAETRLQMDRFQQSWLTGLVALHYVGPSQTRD